MRGQPWPKNRAEVERLEHDQYLRDEAEYERQQGDEYESQRDYVDRMSREVDSLCPSCGGQDGRHEMSCIYRPTPKGARLSMNREERRE